MERAETLAALRRGDLAGAREIRLPDGLTEFPEALFGLADTLELLDLGRGSYTLPDGFGRFRALKVLFCSGTPFPRLPPVLGDCPALGQVGFRGCGIGEVPAEALPPNLRWLTLTDNRIAALPDALGERPRLQKLMLSGNRLTHLPDSLAGAGSLELVRFASNRLARLPNWLAALPALAWVSYSGNPAEPPGGVSDAARIPWAALAVGELLGEGSSGRVHRAAWRGEAGPAEVALKLFKGAIGSDGLPEREIEACLAAGDHPALIGALGRLDGHPDGTPGLLLRLLPADWRVLAGPPSLASCSRDVYDPALSVTPEAARRLASGIASALAHLHARGLMHGDLYGHNILWDGGGGGAVLGDFGAASSLPAGEAGRALARIETRAFGILLGEVLHHCDGAPPALHDLARACTGPDPAARPDMADVAAMLV
ncbi:leucine-rich repeat-containing protein kinase family protein [Methylobacterium sp. J-076]|uniref:leucine-rich repeat-containing protein kinase family protein n=1 Tax=Methylobacterium sp. J-076 TaxID=2836655 RepID=UPI001FB98032|nr:leucine-rich repeat-containing protein kinase family protein [Methylobacterium sp. J-076]MCJ2015749.1 leucine-rich repeat-containing serine/threonine-protein kinase [Methylobacterium sp. J-076]